MELQSMHCTLRSIITPVPTQVGRALSDQALELLDVNQSCPFGPRFLAKPLTDSLLTPSQNARITLAHGRCGCCQGAFTVLI
jgi:hypothetical protein